MPGADSAAAGPATIRRVVTGHDSDGRSIIVLDQMLPATHTGAALDPRTLTEIWATTKAEPPARARASPTLGPQSTEMRVVDMMPGSRRELHRTDTIDYGIVILGEIHLVLERAETTLRSGDIVVQRGTLHAWHNRTSQVARIAFVNMSGQVTDLGRCPQV